MKIFEFFVQFCWITSAMSLECSARYFSLLKIGFPPLHPTGGKFAEIQALKLPFFGDLRIAPTRPLNVI
jgi:hypothetical protein